MRLFLHSRAEIANLCHGLARVPNHQLRDLGLRWLARSAASPRSSCPPRHWHVAIGDKVRERSERSGPYGRDVTMITKPSPPNDDSSLPCCVAERQTGPRRIEQWIAV